MLSNERIYILGGGAVGMSLAVFLSNQGRDVTVVRTSTGDVDPRQVEVTITTADGTTRTAPVEMVSLAKLRSLDGIVVVTAKSYANDAIAAALAGLNVSGPVVILQNGAGVEDAYLRLPAARIYRCCMYCISQKDAGDNAYRFIRVVPSPIGAMRGDPQELDALVRQLDTAEFPFAVHGDIRREVWKKTTVNSVFNSICPLLEADNGIFARDENAVRMARVVIDECLAVAHAMGIDLNADEVLRQILTLSSNGGGKLISTLQDINAGRPTEIEQMNLAIARIGETLAPPVPANVTRALGEMVRIKSALRRAATPAPAG
ncbi:2-dehydropantoate 2-reductase [Ramlibacter sp.]|uniref:ketopantoate reductase family protein n=1 Tax=Ramlibacter sp. TaxID=1917967 RepID=UPI0017EBB311|nr:2-dehydropantoate 2-reductase [Ramlibacter sp.]MBA2673862.1 2-dehydropantoate 2-reductase [Ramlibacter sp.]